MEFTSWDMGFASWDPNELEHYGIPGMHWGVRRYQNKDGSLTPAGEARYGARAEGSSARKMTKDFNRLDKGYANVVANQRYYAAKTAKLARKAHKAEKKGHTEKAQKLLAKSLKNAQRAALDNQRKNEIEKLQWKIIGKAAVKGYTVTSTPVTRMAVAGRQKLAAIGLGMLIHPSTTGVMLGTNMTEVSGQNVKISKRGNGRINITNYSAGKAAEQRLRAEENARKRKDYRNR